jgi:hypothetical protein
MKPVELMTEKEQQEYHLAVRKAMLQGDNGVLPDGRTVKQTREEYAQKCAEDPFRTRTYSESIAEEALEDEFPGQVVATPESEVTLDPEIENKRCCG